MPDNQTGEICKACYAYDMLRKMLFPALLPGCLLLASLSTNAQPQTEDDQKVYRKFHPDGVVEFSDQPSRDSEPLKLQELPTYKFTPAKPATKTAPNLTPRAKQKSTPSLSSPYTSLTLTKPTRDETIRANDGVIAVQFNLAPRLQYFKGHKIEYLLDGKSILKTDRPPPSIKDVSRGTHSLVIQIIDKNNKVLINSDSVSFHVKRFFKSRIQPTPSSQNTVDFDAEYET